jgi:hypothetical protein
MHSSLETLWRVVFSRSVGVLRLQLLNLSVDGKAAASNTKKYENGQKNPLGSKPLVKIVAYGETKTDTAHHGQSQLRNQYELLKNLPGLFTQHAVQRVQRMLV